MKRPSTHPKINAVKNAHKEKKPLKWRCIIHEIILSSNPTKFLSLDIFHFVQGAEEVTREQFAVLWQEFWQSDDPLAPGNFIFGKTTF